MNVEEIKVQTQLQISMKIQLQYAIRFINEGLNELAIAHTTACKRDNFIIDVIKDTWTDLPNDFIEKKEVKLNGVDYKGYEIDDNQIKCDQGGKLEIRYLRLPKPVTSKSDIPEIHLAYHYPLALFVASKEKSRLFGDEDMESVRFMNEFLRKSSMAHSRIRKKGGRIRV